MNIPITAGQIVTFTATVDTLIQNVSASTVMFTKTQEDSHWLHMDYSDGMEVKSGETFYFKSSMDAVLSGMEL